MAVTLKDAYDGELTEVSDINVTPFIDVILVLLILSVKPDLTLALGYDDVPRVALQTTLDQQTNHDREQRIFLRADGAVSYSELMKVMNLLRDSGYLKIALVGLEDTGQGSATPAALPVTKPAADKAQ